MVEKTTIPSGADQYVTITRYELLGHLRKKRIWVIFIVLFLIFFFVLLLFPAAGVDYPSTFEGYSQIYLGFMSVLILLCATLFGSDALVGEFQQRTGFVLFPNPVKRLTIFLGKFSASMIASVIVISVYYGLIVLFIGGMYKTVTIELAYSLLLAVLYLSAALGVAYAISAIMKGIIGSTVLTFILFLFVLPMVGMALGMAEVDPWFLVTQSGDTVTYVMEPEYQAGKFCIQQARQTICFYVPELATSAATMAGYFIASSILAFLFFRRREMVG
ncbi:MAG: ABC transporter permease [Thermoplasmata archaeon]|nr:ABC transporter permease [Thermoplasmata archaeon]